MSSATVLAQEMVHRTTIYHVEELPAAVREHLVAAAEGIIAHSRAASGGVVVLTVPPLPTRRQVVPGNPAARAKQPS